MLSITSANNSALICSLPLELFIKKIIPFLSWDIRALCAFACTATWASTFTRQTSEDKGDINLQCEWGKFDGQNSTIKACALQILKIEVLKNHPELLENLSVAKAAVVAKGKDPNDIACLLEYAHTDPSTSMLSCGYSFSYVALISSILPFDFQTKKIAADADFFADVLKVTFYQRKIDLAQLFLAHPASQNLKASGRNSNLGHLLIAASSINCPTLVREVLALPNAPDIDEYQLGSAFVYAAKNNSLEVAKLVLSQENAEEIPGNAEINVCDHASTLFVALLYAVRAKNPALVREIVSHSNANNIPIIGLSNYGLQSSLIEATRSGDPELIAAVLGHPNIASLPTDILIAAMKAVIPGEDKEILLEFQQLLNAPDSDAVLTQAIETFGRLSEATQNHLFLLLSNTYGDLTEDIDIDRMAHFIDCLEKLTILNNKSN